MGTRTVYVSAAEPVTSSVDCGGCASVKVHRRVCTEREVSKAHPSSPFSFLFLFLFGECFSLVGGDAGVGVLRGGIGS